MAAAAVTTILKQIGSRYEPVKKRPGHKTGTDPQAPRDRRAFAADAASVTESLVAQGIAISRNGKGGLRHNFIIGHLRRRAVGKLSALTALLGQQPLKGSLGIGHTRWATHGAPNEANAHPHRAGPVAVVHNGIIENFRVLRSSGPPNGHGAALRGQQKW